MVAASKSAVSAASKALTPENFARILTRIEQLEGQVAMQGAGSSSSANARSGKLSASTSPAGTSSSAVSALDLRELEARLTSKIEERLATQIEAKLTSQIEARLTTQIEIKLKAKLTKKFTEKLHAQEATYAQKFQEQTSQIQHLQTKSLILRAKLDGRNDVFYLFPMLPPEIRSMIWKLALHPGRVIEVSSKPRQFMTVFGKVGRRPDGPLFPCQFPSVFDVARNSEVLLFTCRESRRIAKEETWESCFNYKPNPICTFFPPAGDAAIPHDELIPNSGVSFRPKRDVIFFRRRDMEPQLTKALCVHACSGINIGNISILAVDLEMLNELFVWGRFFSTESGPPMLTNIEQLILVDCSGNFAEGREVYPEYGWKKYTPLSVKDEVTKRFESPLYIAAPIIKVMTEGELMAWSG